MRQEQAIVEIAGNRVPLSAVQDWRFWVILAGVIALIYLWRRKW